MSDTSFHLSLICDERDASCHVVNAEVRSDRFVHRITFTAQDDLDSALSPDLAREVRLILDDLPDRQAVFSAPDRVVQVPGLILGRLRVLVHQLGQGMSRVTIRFKYFVGSLAAAFRRQAYMAAPTMPHREAAALAALQDICLPACDMATLDDRMLSAPFVRQKLDERLALMRERRDELYFHIELLKRFLNQNGPEPEEPALPRGPARGFALTSV